MIWSLMENFGATFASPVLLVNGFLTIGAFEAEAW